MSEDGQNKAGPALSEAIQEIQGRFPNDAALQDAISRLTLLGVDRAELSQPSADALDRDTPDQADAANSDLDTQQVRTLASGFTGAAVGVGAAAVLATGGLAAPLVAAGAVIGAIATSAATSGVGIAAGDAGKADRDRLGAEGKLILAVRIKAAEQVGPVEAAMRDAGATEVTEVTRTDDALTAGVSAASWTGL